MGLRKYRESTATSLVMAYLRRVDDMVTCKAIATELKIPYNRVNAALWMLNQYHAVQFVEGKRLYWFANPPELDTRTREVLERAPETKPRKPRKNHRLDKK